jgi:murein L,D-transpeptidase YafK
MTDDNLKARRLDQWAGFWADLKKGDDLFERTQMPPVVRVCNGRYAFSPGSAATVGSAIEDRCPPEVAANS